MRSLTLCSIALLAALAAASVTPARSAASSAYTQMSDARRLTYVKTHAKEVARLLAADGERPVSITDDAAWAIKARVDRYAARVGTGATGVGREDLSTVFARAASAVPTVNRVFDAAGLPRAYGVYLAFIESEYNDGVTSPLGSRGVFQFIPSTGLLYGLEGDDVLDLEKSASAAAHYLNDRRAEFAGEPARTLLALLSYNSGSKYITAELRPALEAAGRVDHDATIWSMSAHPERFALSKYFNEEGKGYIPSFFAAAIVGERPRDFGLDAEPLTK